MPAIAVPKVEPRLEMLRERPEISPCSVLGEARLHDVHRRGQHRTQAEADQQKPRHEGDDPGGGMNEAEKSPIPARVTRKPATISVRCENFFASRCRGEGRDQTPTVAAVKTTPVPIALYPRTSCRKTETTNDTPMRRSHCMFWVTRARLQVRFRNSPVDSSGSFRRAPGRGCRGRTRAGTRSRARGTRPSARCCAGLQDPEDDEEHADRREDRADGVEGSRRVGRERIDEPAAEEDDRRDDQPPGRRTRPAS